MPTLGTLESATLILWEAIFITLPLVATFGKMPKRRGTSIITPFGASETDGHRCRTTPQYHLDGRTPYAGKRGDTSPYVEVQLATSSNDPRVVSVGEGREEVVPGVSLEWLADGSLMPGCEMTFGRVQLKPGASNPPHFHPNCQELLFVLQGTLEHTLGMTSVQLSEGSLLHIPQGVIHNARNTGNTSAILLVAYSTERRQTIFMDEPDP